MEKLERPKITKGPTERVSTGCGSIYVTVNRDDKGNLLEVFAHLGKAGNCIHAQLEAVSRTITLGLKYGIPVEEFTKELREIKCPSKVWDDGSQVLSCADAIAQALTNESRDFESHQVPG